MHIQCERTLLSQVYNKWPHQGAAILNQRPGILSNWYARIITFLDNEFLLIVHNQSLLTMVEFLDLSSADSLNQVFINVRGKISEILQEYYFVSDHQLIELLKPFSAVTFGKIEDSQFADVMHKIAQSYQKKFLQAKRRTRNGEIRLWEIEDSLNNIPHPALGDVSPFDTMYELVRSGLN